MARVTWRLQEQLEASRITRHQLAQAMTGKTDTRLTTLYRMDDPKRIDLGILAEIVAAMRKLTGRNVEVGDLLTFDE